MGLPPYHGGEYSAEAQDAEKKEENSDALDKSRVIGFVDLHPAYEKGKHDRGRAHADHHSQEPHGPNRPWGKA